MNVKPLRTMMIGFGKMASAYANDPIMAKYYRYATHAQVLVDNPSYQWVAVVDPSLVARKEARERWGVGVVAESVANIGSLASEIDVAVLATPPESRIGILDSLPNLRAVLVEKPLGRTFQESADFLRSCRERNILVQVNLWRRADEQFQNLSTGGLKKLIGEVQILHGVYGNGLLNNGTHLIDFIRMLLGEVASVEILGQRASFVEGPIAGDVNVGFVLNLTCGLVVPIQPIQFTNYREVGFEIWGKNGHLSILNEGLTLAVKKRCVNRGMAGEYEIPFDKISYLKATVGLALFNMYQDLAMALLTGKVLCSSGDSALKTSQVVAAIMESSCRVTSNHIFDLQEKVY